MAVIFALLTGEATKLMSLVRLVLAADPNSLEAHYILAWRHLILCQTAEAKSEWSKLEAAIEDSDNPVLAMAVTAERPRFAP